MSMKQPSYTRLSPFHFGNPYNIGSHKSFPCWGSCEETHRIIIAHLWSTTIFAIKNKLLIVMPKLTLQQIPFERLVRDRKRSISVKMELPPTPTSKLT